MTGGMTGVARRAAIGAVMAVGLYLAFGPLGGLAGLWFAFSPDAVAATGRSGGTGALAAGGRAAWGYLADEWRRGAPARQRRRTARRDRWWAAGGIRRRALTAEHGLVIATRFLRSLWPAGKHGAHAIPAGARQAVAAERARRRRRRAGETGGRHRADSTGRLGGPADAPGTTPAGATEPVEPSAGRQNSGDRPVTGAPPHPRLPLETPAAQPGPQPGEGDQMTVTDTAPAQADGDHGQAPGDGELQHTSDLRAEVAAICQMLEEAGVLAGLLRDWQTEVPDRYQQGVAAGGPNTRALRDAVGEIVEAGGDAAALGEALGALRRACDQADALGDQAGAMGADGHTRGYVPA
jgi:hypothetical protein